MHDINDPQNLLSELLARSRGQKPVPQHKETFEVKISSVLADNIEDDERVHHAPHQGMLVGNKLIGVTNQAEPNLSSEQVKEAIHIALDQWDSIRKEFLRFDTDHMKKLETLDVYKLFSASTVYFANFAAEIYDIIIGNIPNRETYDKWLMCETTPYELVLQTRCELLEGIIRKKLEADNAIVPPSPES